MLKSKKTEQALEQLLLSALVNGQSQLYRREIKGEKAQKLLKEM